MLFSDLPGWSIAGIFVWLGAMSFLDYRTHEVPHYGSTVPMLLAGVLRVFWPPVSQQAAWMSSLAVVLLLLAVVLSDHVWLTIVLLGISAALAGACGPQMLTLSIGWSLALLGALGGLWGGGDAKIVMALLALCPDWRLGLFLLGGLSVGSALVMLLKYKTALPLALLNTLGDLLAWRLPTDAATDGYTRSPCVPWLTLGAVSYVLWGVLL